MSQKLRLFTFTQDFVHSPSVNQDWGTLVHLVSCARNLCLYCSLILQNHVKIICKAGWFGINKIGKLVSTMKQLRSSIVHAFYSGLIGVLVQFLAYWSATELQKLRRLQNTAAMLVSRTSPNDHITPVLSNLHWLPIHLRAVLNLK